MSVELKNLETVIGALYQSPRKPLEEDDLDTLTGLHKSTEFIFGPTLMRKIWIETLG